MNSDWLVFDNTFKLSKMGYNFSITKEENITLLISKDGKEKILQYSTFEQAFDFVRKYLLHREVEKYWSTWSLNYNEKSIEK